MEMLNKLLKIKVWIFKKRQMTKKQYIKTKGRPVSIREKNVKIQEWSNMKS